MPITRTARGTDGHSCAKSRACGREYLAARLAVAIASLPLTPWCHVRRQVAAASKSSSATSSRSKSPPRRSPMRPAHPHPRQEIADLTSHARSYFVTSTMPGGATAPPGPSRRSLTWSEPTRSATRSPACSKQTANQTAHSVRTTGSGTSSPPNRHSRTNACPGDLPAGVTAGMGVTAGVTRLDVYRGGRRGLDHGRPWTQVDSGGLGWTVAPSGR